MVIQDGTMVKCELMRIKLHGFFFLKIFFFLNSFFRHLRNISIESDLNKPNIEFNADGDLKNTELKIMNLRPSVSSKNLVWEEVKAIIS